MSNLMFPRLRGIAWNTHIAQSWKTGRQEARSGREVTMKFRAAPRMKITISYGVNDDGFLSDKPPKPSTDGSPVYSDFETLFGFIGQLGGEHASFLFQGTNDIDAAKFNRTGEIVGLGDGATTDFQLVRNVGGWMEPMFWPMADPVIYADGVIVTFTVLGNGLYRLTAAPTAGQLVTADFTAAYRCKFDSDEIDFDNFMAYLWECPTVALITVKP